MRKLFVLAALASAVTGCGGDADVYRSGPNVRGNTTVWPYRGNISVGIDGISGGAYPSPANAADILGCFLGRRPC